ncbi:MAG: DUF1634 domain-containing protein [Chloroflexota bacterium]
MSGPGGSPEPNQVVIGEEPPSKSAHIEFIVSNVLRYGVLLSFVIILIGSVMLFIQGGQAATVRLVGAPNPHSPGQVISDLLQLQPKAVIDFGLMLLIATPVMRVAVSVIAFLVEEDVIYTLVTLFVLAVLLVSFFLGAVE